MITDRREPGVYVSIEDMSYVAENPNVGRAVYCVGVCQQGPHNRVVQVTSQAEFHRIFGKPNIYKTSRSHYHMDKAMQYSGRGLYVRIVPADATQSQAMIKKVSDTESDLTTLINKTFGWSNSSELVCSTDCSGDLSVGNWIFSEDETATGYAFAKQIISLEVETDGTTSITLDSAYTGEIGDAGAYKFVPYEIVNDTGWDTSYALPEGTDAIDTDIVYSIYGIGAGAKYNDYKIKGFRNTELEKMFVDEDGNPQYKYMFMDIGVYKVASSESNNTIPNDVLVEGPWRVSLTDETPDGKKIRDLTTGQPLFIENVINNNSGLIHFCAGAAYLDLKAEASPTKVTELRKQIMMLLSAGQPAATSFVVEEDTGLTLASGFDGTTDGLGTGSSHSLYDDTTGIIYIDENIEGLATQAYNGSLTSVDGSIEQIKEVTYPVYQPDYILTGEWPAATQNAGRQLADMRQDCIHLGDTGYQTSYTADLDARLNDVPWNNWTSALYVQFRKRRDEYTGEMITVSPCYHAIENHLVVDGNYFLGEPVAGIEKGAIAEPIELVYTANHTERGDLGDAELNLTIVEPDGKYFLTQFTTWKRLSILKRLHAAKFVAFVRKSIPPLLKDLLQRKGTDFWVNQGQSRVDYFLSKYLNTDVEALKMLTNYSVRVEFDEVASELNVYIGLTPIRVIERINVYIAVS
jgi:hypothetical protein